MEKSNHPLVVDLDGTLIKSDLLFESFYSMLKKNLLLVFAVPLWILKGKAYLKNRIAEHSHITAETLPYQAEFLNYLKEEHSQGRTLILATASNQKFAQSITNHLGIFQSVFASDEKTNLSGKKKLELLLKNYGPKGFDYAGNDNPDLVIFASAREGILVNPKIGVLKKAKQSTVIKHIFKDSKPNLFLYLKAIRAYQWVKNALLFVPLIVSHKWSDHPTVLIVLLGFISFSFCASAGYMFNDLLDLSADRSHPRKKNRPFASGNISIASGTFLMLFLQIIGLGIAFALNLHFFLLVILYCVISLSYTLHLKTYVLIDVLTLAGLYTLRIIVGTVLASAPLSFWLFSFSIFIFFSLALVKRCSELLTLAKTNKDYAVGRDYGVADVDYLREMGIASGYMAILIFALYINSPDVAVLYSKPKLLWIICPILFYWISRIWLKTGRGEMTDDPIVFSFKDRGSHYVMVAIIIIIFLSI